MRRKRRDSNNASRFEMKMYSIRPKFNWVKCDKCDCEFKLEWGKKIKLYDNCFSIYDNNVEYNFCEQCYLEYSIDELIGTAFENFKRLRGGR